MSNLILESPILQEVQFVKQDATRCRFKCVLQTSDDLNRNKRIYPKDVLEQGMNDKRDQMKTKSFYGELDHPMSKGDPHVDGQRQTTVMLKEVSHYITEYEWNGNKLIAKMETATTPNGKILFALIRDNSTVGFSMRGLAELDRKQDHSIVKGPLTIISYDSVSTPSHSASVVNFNEMTFESENIIQNKNGNIITEMCNIQEGLDTVCFNGKCFLNEYFDRLVETKTIQFFNRWI